MEAWRAMIGIVAREREFVLGGNGLQTRTRRPGTQALQVAIQAVERFTLRRARGLHRTRERTVDARPVTLGLGCGVFVLIYAGEGPAVQAN